MKKDEIRVKLLMTLGVAVAVFVFFLLTIRVYDNSTAKYAYDFVNEEKTEIEIKAYFGNPVNFKIPSEIDGYKVVKIGKNAFAQNIDMKKLEIPSSVKVIGENAFAGCTKLRSVKIENGLEEIGYQAFFNCKLLKTVELPDTLLKIDHEAFRNCEQLENLVIPKSCESIGVDAFRACMSLTLDCSQNEMALEYANEYSLVTDFSQSTRQLYIKVFGAVAICIVFVVGVYLAITKLIKKDKVEIHFVDSEQSRQDKYKDGLIDHDHSKVSSAKRVKSKKSDKKE